MMTGTVIIITIGSFFAAFVNAAFATGGVYILLFTALAVLPVSAAIPLQSAFAAASLVGRTYFFWRDINWPIVLPFVIGALIGVGLGTQAFAVIAENIILTILGVVLLVFIWMPNPKKTPQIKHPFFYVGVVHSFFGALLGVGGVMQPLMLRTKLKKHQITGTLAACMLTLDAFKAVGYTSIGFDYGDYIPHIFGATLAGFAGTWAGKRASHLISEALFRQVFRAFVTLIALRFLYTGLMGG